MRAGSGRASGRNGEGDGAAAGARRFHLDGATAGFGGTGQDVVDQQVTAGGRVVGVGGGDRDGLVGDRLDDLAGRVELGGHDGVGGGPVVEFGGGAQGARGHGQLDTCWSGLAGGAVEGGDLVAAGELDSDRAPDAGGGTVERFDQRHGAGREGVAVVDRDDFG